MAPKPPITVALVGRTFAAWLVTLLLFFPLGWLVLTAFKTEKQAISVPPLLVFMPTLENFAEVQQRSDYLLFATNSVITSVVSTLLGLAIAFPAAYSMAFFRGKWTRDLLMWMLSTKMMPAVGALVPIYVLAQTAGLLDTRLALIIVFMLSNLPIMVWMLYSSLKDIPHEILEAARMDGAGSWRIFQYMTLPHLRQYLELGIVLGSIYLVQTFDAIFMITSGGPGQQTTNLPFYIYETAFRAFNIGRASAMGVVVVVATIAIATFALRVVSGLFSDEGMEGRL